MESDTAVIDAPDAGPAPDDAPDAQSGASPADLAPAEQQLEASTDDSQDSSTREEESPYSLAEAFREAQAELAAEEDGDSTHADSQASTEATVTPQGAETPPEPATTTERTLTEQGALRRIQTLAEQGRLSELSPEARGELTRLRDSIIASHEAQRAEDQEFLDLYVSVERMRSEDPDQYLQKIEEDPGLEEFRRSFRRDHPDVDIDNPTLGDRRPDPKQVREQAWRDFAASRTAALAEVAAASGITEARFNELTREANGPTSLEVLVVREAIKAEAEAARARIAAEEREAAEAAAQAERASKVIVPRSIGGTPTAQSRPGLAPTGPVSIRDAFLAAKAEMEAS